MSDTRTSMTDNRRKEIALKYVENQILERGIPGKDSLRRELGNEAKRLDISTDELLEFYQSFVPKLLGNIFGYSKVSLEMSEPQSRVKVLD